MLENILEKQGLSKREIQVAGLVVCGMSNQEIAHELCVTPKTVKFHLTSIYKKMNLKSRAQLIVWCVPHINFSDKVSGVRGQTDPNKVVTPPSPAKEESKEARPFLFSGNEIIGDGE